MPVSLADLHAWCARQGWQASAFQRACWAAIDAGHSGLLHAPTGAGKTLAVWGGLLASLPRPQQLGVLWITPMRALARDSERQLDTLQRELQADWRVARRTADVSASQRRSLLQHPPQALVSTPESLALMLSEVRAVELLRGLQAVVVDEWHELLGSKRGVLLQLGLARLRSGCAGLRVWGLSASLGNPQQALRVLCPTGVLVQDPTPRPWRMQTLLPEPARPLPWAGRLGLIHLPAVHACIQQARSSLIYTQTRAQAELWFQALAAVWTDAPETLALHHGSLEASLRETVEQDLAAGRLRAVVCTATLDLGVDFAPVEQVIQIGSPKSASRLLQRAGRSGHTPGGTPRVWCVPTHALELAEFGALRLLLESHTLEARTPPEQPLDVLAQHLVTLALGGGYDPAVLHAEVCSTWSYRNLTPATWAAVLQVVTCGGTALERYPDFRRVEVDAHGRHTVTCRRVALLHRTAIGTIAESARIEVRFERGARLGHIEERELGRLRPGDRFIFAGRALTLKRFDAQTAWVALTRNPATQVPQWLGGRLPWSEELAQGLRQFLDLPADASPERAALQPMLVLQTRVSALPGPAGCLLECYREARSWRLCAYPMAGRQMHEGLAAVWALRLARGMHRSAEAGQERGTPVQFSVAVNDWGLLLESSVPVACSAADAIALLDPAGLKEDIQDCLNLAELASRQFREIARIGGLLHPGLPGRLRGARHLQMSAQLLYGVLREHDPEHPLLRQADAEVLEQALDLGRLERLLHTLHRQPVHWCEPTRLSPWAFPLWAERQRFAVGTLDWEQQVAAAAAALQQALQQIAQ